VDLFPIMGDVQMAFGILTHCFVQCPLYFLQCTPLSSTFIKSFISFDSSLLQMFERLLGLGSFNSPKGPLAHKQACLPITFGGIELISTSTIAPTTYLGNWALITIIIIVRFMVDQHPFLVEAVTQINNNTFLSNNTSRQHVIFYHPQPVHVFLHFNNSSCNKLFNFKIPSRSISTIIPFPICSLMGHLKPIMLEFIMFWPKGGCLA